jgi:hypothetical protein
MIARSLFYFKVLIVAGRSPLQNCFCQDRKPILADSKSREHDCHHVPSAIKVIVHTFSPR